MFPKAPDDPSEAKQVEFEGPLYFELVYVAMEKEAKSSVL